MTTALEETYSVRLVVIPDRSAVVVEAATSFGPVIFGACGLEGYIEVGLREGEPDFAMAHVAHLEVDLDRLTSGNTAYDGELRRHLNARRFPHAYIDLLGVSRVEATRSYLVGGELTLAGVTVPVEGEVEAHLADGSSLLVLGQETLDIRLFGIAAPTVFMLRVEPVVRVSLHLEAEAARL